MLKKLALKSGLNRENTRYTQEGGYYESEKIRFRQGTPEKIGGWERISTATFLGTCRSLWAWVTISAEKLIGVGTNLKFYIESGGAYRDITPLRETVTLTNPFTTSSGLATVTVTHAAHGALNNDFVTYSGATAVGGLTLNGEYEIAFVDGNTYTITASTTASSNATGGGTVTAAYQINVGAADQVPVVGWGTGPWGYGVWGVGTGTEDYLRVWGQQNFGEDLIFGPVGKEMYYWDATTGAGVRGVALSSLPGASDVPLMQNGFIISDASRFVIAFGVNEIGSINQDQMLIRWSDQENAAMWTPAITNQAGSLRLSHGSEITTFVQVRQEILVFTDTALYALQYLGAPYVWGSTLLSDNISIISNRAAAAVSGVTYWMGSDKFYQYDGRVNTLNCDLRQYVFDDFNNDQAQQTFACSLEKFNEVWWFYCSAASTTIDKYVIYNYLEKVWYYGTMERTAWIDGGVRSHYPISAYGQKLLFQEIGNDDKSGDVTLPIASYVVTSEFDIDDGDRFGFVWRILPDITFRGSDVESPAAQMTLYGLANSGSGYNDPASLAGTNTQPVVRTAVVPIEKFTGQIYVRVRGRQMAMKIESTGLGVHWQLGSPRLDIKPDGRR